MGLIYVGIQRERIDDVYRAVFHVTSCVRHARLKVCRTVWTANTMIKVIAVWTSAVLTTSLVLTTL